MSTNQCCEHTIGDKLLNIFKTVRDCSDVCAPRWVDDSVWQIKMTVNIAMCDPQVDDKILNFE